MDSAIFTDGTGREWSLVFTVGNARTIKQRLKLDFVNVWDGVALNAVGSDQEKLVSVLWHLCQGQAAERSITEEQFLDLFNGDVIDAAGRALEEAIVLFCQPAKRPALRAALGQSQKAMEKLGLTAEEKIQSEKFTMVVEKELTKASAEMDSKLDQLISGL